MALLMVTMVAISSAGCATYTDKMRGVGIAASAGNYPGALSAADGLLGVASADQLPARINGDKPLLLLDRGILQQASSQFDGSKNDLSTAEKHLELLDLSKNGLATLGSYLYSDSAKTYRTPPTERLSLNAFNLLNYVALGDLSGAQVEARRFQVMREYLKSVNQNAVAPDRLGAYLAGFVFEKGNEGDRALRYYEEALAGGGLTSLVGPVKRLAQTNPYRGKNVNRVLAGAGKATPRQSELLVVLSVGRVPHKVPTRIPVGAAVGIAGAALGDRDLDILRYSATKVLVYPEMVATPSSLGTPLVTVNGRDVSLELLANLGSSTMAEYEAAKPQILASALTRVAARAGIAEGARAAGRQGSGDLGTVVALLVEATMVALDKPDTRSWTMLPDRVLVARVPVKPGMQDVSVSFRNGYGNPRLVKVDVPQQGWGVVVVTEPR